jgi:hypothetical protein
MPVHIHAPTTIHRNGQGLILMPIWERFFSTANGLPDCLRGWISNHPKKRSQRSQECVWIFCNSFVITDDNLHCS